MLNTRYNVLDERRIYWDMLGAVSGVCRLLARESYAGTKMATADDDVVR